MFLRKTFKALNGLLCADVPLRNYSLTPSLNLLNAPKALCCVSVVIHTLQTVNKVQHVFVCQRLVRICGEVRASPAETDEVMFLCTLCSKLKADPYLINFFIEVECLSLTLFFYFNWILPQQCNHFIVKIILCQGPGNDRENK